MSGSGMQELVVGYECPFEFRLICRTYDCPWLVVRGRMVVDHFHSPLHSQGGFCRMIPSVIMAAALPMVSII
ncbi:hypothetical protein Ptc2401_00952 [Prosthecochloris sp. CIB 2401]|nr:hypothetical protein Ptc2401_00952 [Prosthecochloris sp. CIB 2401]